MAGYNPMMFPYDSGEDSSEEEEEGPFTNLFAEYFKNKAYNALHISPSNKASTIDIVMIEQEKSEDEAKDWVEKNRLKHLEYNPRGFYAVWEYYQFPDRNYLEAVVELSEMIDFLTFSGGHA
jgi:hypothetical protein